NGFDAQQQFLFFLPGQQQHAPVAVGIVQQQFPIAAACAGRAFDADGNGEQLRHGRRRGRQALRTNSDFRLIAPKPSILQSISWSLSTRRMFLTLVPILSVPPEPFSFRSLMMVTVSPSCRMAPLASR